MDDQKDKLLKMNIGVSALHGNNKNKDQEIFEIIDGRIKIIYMSPEYLINGDGLELVNSMMSKHSRYHCVAEAGLRALANICEDGDETEELLKGDRFLIEDESPGLGSPMLRHLRQHARYLAPEAGITSGDLWTMISIWTRNTLLMQLTVFMALFFLISFFQAAPLVFQWLVRDGSPYSLLWFGMTIVQILCVATASACGLCELRKVLKGNKQEQIKAGAGMPAVVITGCLAIASVCGGAQIFAGFADGQKSVWADTPCQIFAGLLALSSSIMMGMARRYQFPPEKKWGRVLPQRSWQ
jgi:hypothetical protein